MPSPPPPPDFQHPAFQGRIGVARVDITPPVGVYARNWGAAQHDVADSIHRPLTLTALTLAAPTPAGPGLDRPLALIDADLGWWKTPATFQRYYRRLLDELQMESSQLLLALTHTHAGPPMMDPDPSLPGSDLLADWIETTYQATVRAVRQALANPFDGLLEWSAGRCGLASVRDLPDPASSTGRVVCGFFPGGDPDDALLVGRITDSSGVTRATLVNYACHPTTLAWDNRAISPDYVGAMRELMQQTTHAPALFLLGICGDLGPRYQYVGDPSVADRHGRQLGFAALATLEGMEPPGTRLAFKGTVESGAPLAVWKHAPREASSVLRSIAASVELPLKDWPSADELEKQRLACTDRALEERLRRKRDIRQSLGDGATYRLPVYAWRMGDVALVGTCCEPYSILQRELRRRFADRTLACMNLVNGSIGYLPPADLYDTEVYPVWQTPFDRGSLERTLTTMTEVLQNVFAD